MAKKPIYEELEQKIKELEKEAVEYKRVEEDLIKHLQIALLPVFSSTRMKGMCSLMIDSQRCMVIQQKNCRERNIRH